jgi:hypothetical protein
MKKVIMLFRLREFEMKEVMAEEFLGEIYVFTKGLISASETVDRLNLKKCHDLVIVTKGGGCHCSQDDYSEHSKYFTYRHNPNGADEIWQCWECGFQWRRVRQYIDAHPEQLVIHPTALKEDDGFKRIFPVE